MKIKTVFSLLAASAVISLSASPNAGRIFDSTIKYADTDGIFLLYQNNASAVKNFERLPEAWAAKIQDKQKAALFKEVMRAVVKVVNLKVVQGTVVSDIEVSDGIYRFKAFSYLGKNMHRPSICDIYGKVNKPLTWQELPSDTRIAFKTDIMPGAVIKRVIAELKKSKSRQLADFAGQLEMMQVPAYAETVSGDISLLVYGSSLETFGVKMVISDKNGSLKTFINSILPLKAGEKSCKVPLPLDAKSAQFISPELIFDNGTITFVSHRKVLEKPAETLASIEKFKAFAALLPNDGNGYFVINFDKQTLNYLALMTGEPKVRELVDSVLSPVAGVSVGQAMTDGYLNVTLSDFSISQNMPKIYGAMLGGMLLPALNSAREKARQVSCTANLKQLGLGLQLYANDNGDVLPAANGIAGVNALFPQYLNDKKLLRCPSAENDTGCSYIFVGGGLKLTDIDANTYPVLFDKPENHKNKVNVVFADGHVEVLSLKNYNSPRQVIGTLSKKYKYSPQLLEKLLRAVSEN